MLLQLHLEDRYIVRCFNLTVQGVNPKPMPQLHTNFAQYCNELYLSVLLLIFCSIAKKF